MFFGSLGSKSFAALCDVAQALVKSSEKAVQYVDAVEDQSLSILNAAE
jgi:hypothetical protein